jgi:hypothetical protein
LYIFPIIADETAGRVRKGALHPELVNIRKRGHNLFLAKALPEADFSYFSNAKALFSSVKAM